MSDIELNGRNYSFDLGEINGALAVLKTLGYAGFSLPVEFEMEIVPNDQQFSIKINGVDWVGPLEQKDLFIAGALKMADVTGTSVEFLPQLPKEIVVKILKHSSPLTQLRNRHLLDGKVSHTALTYESLLQHDDYLGLLEEAAKIRDYETVSLCLSKIDKVTNHQYKSVAIMCKTGDQKLIDMYMDFVHDCPADRIPHYYIKLLLSLVEGNHTDLFTSYFLDLIPGIDFVKIYIAQDLLDSMQEAYRIGNSRIFKTIAGFMLSKGEDIKFGIYFFRNISALHLNNFPSSDNIEERKKIFEFVDNHVSVTPKNYLTHAIIVGDAPLFSKYVGRVDEKLRYELWRQVCFNKLNPIIFNELISEPGVIERVRSNQYDLHAIAEYYIFYNDFEGMRWAVDKFNFTYIGTIRYKNISRHISREMFEYLYSLKILTKTTYIFMAVHLRDVDLARKILSENLRDENLVYSEDVDAKLFFDILPPSQTYSNFLRAYISLHKDRFVLLKRYLHLLSSDDLSNLFSVALARKWRKVSTYVLSKNLLTTQQLIQCISSAFIGNFMTDEIYQMLPLDLAVQKQVLKDAIEYDSVKYVKKITELYHQTAEELIGSTELHDILLRSTNEFGYVFDVYIYLWPQLRQIDRDLFIKYVKKTTLKGRVRDLKKLLSVIPRGDLTGFDIYGCAIRQNETEIRRMLEYYK